MLLVGTVLLSLGMFLCASTVEKATEEAKIPDSVHGGSGERFYLTNHLISEIADIFKQAGLGTEEEVYLTIIPPLIRGNNLPSAECVAEHFRERAREHEVSGNWAEAFWKYIWTFCTSSAGITHQ